MPSQLKGGGNVVPSIPKILCLHCYSTVSQNKPSLSTVYRIKFIIFRVLKLHQCHCHCLPSFQGHWPPWLFEQQVSVHSVPQIPNFKVCLKESSTDWQVPRTCIQACILPNKNALRASAAQVNNFIFRCNDRLASHIRVALCSIISWAILGIEAFIWNGFIANLCYSNTSLDFIWFAWPWSHNCTNIASLQCKP